jgi:hypothetical protein
MVDDQNTKALEEAIKHTEQAHQVAIDELQSKN